MLKCTGVVSIVSVNGDACAGARSRRSRASGRWSASTLPYDPCPTIKTGTMVEVVHGPLTGVVGRLTRKGTQARLILAVNLIGQGVSVQVDAADVRAR